MQEMTKPNNIAGTGGKLSVIALACVLSLSACSTREAKRETYEAIKEQLRAELELERKQAASHAAVAAALLPPVAGSLPAPRPPAEERFSLALNNVNAQQFFLSLVAGTRYNMMVHPEVNGNLSANLKDVTLIEALNAIREVYGYDYKIEGNRIYIKPLTMQTRVFQVNYLTTKRLGSSDVRVSNGTSVDNGGTQNTNNSSSNNSNNSNSNRNNNNQSGSGNTTVESSRISSSSQSDFWQELKQALDAIIATRGEGRSVVMSPQSGVVVVRAMPDELRNVEEYLKATQLAVERQVILEAKILEVELSDGYQSGVNWAAFGALAARPDNLISAGVVSPGTVLSPLPAVPELRNTLGSSGSTGISALTGSALGANSGTAGTLFGLAFQTSSFAALMSFLESQGSVHVLSSPRIATLNNQKAVLKIGTDDFFVTGITGNTTNNNSNNNNNNTTTVPTVNLQSFFSGVVLDVTPQIDDKGNITLHVHPSVSQVSTVNKVINLGTGGVFNLPLASSSTSETDSVVRGQNGRIVAIGGLMRQATSNERSQVPGSSKLPLLGGLFGSSKQVTQKRELVILIKPTIVDNNQVFGDDVMQTLRRVEQVGAYPGAGAPGNNPR